jgi:ABC-type glycerol-3-phosphate transport system substrate-binding protein
LISLLEWAKKYGIPDEEAEEGKNSGQLYATHEELISQGRLALIDVSFGSPSQIYSYDSWFSFGEPMTLIGFPSPNRVGLSAATLDYAISQSCEHPQAAWEFITILLSEEIQSEIIKYEYGVPTRLSSIEFLTEFVQHPDDYPELISDPDLESTWDPEEQKAYEEFLRDVAIPAFNSLVYNDISIRRPDEDLINIVLEEAVAYFNDMKTAEEVAGIIQNRAQTLFNERAK